MRYTHAMNLSSVLPLLFLVLVGRKGLDFTGNRRVK